MQQISLFRLLPNHMLQNRGVLKVPASRAENLLLLHQGDIVPTVQMRRKGDRQNQSLLHSFPHLVSGCPTTRILERMGLETLY